MVPKSVRRENLNIFKLHFWAVSFRSFLFLNNRVIFRASSSPDKHAAGLKVCEFFGVIILGTFGPCEIPQISNVCKTLSSCFRGHIQIHFFPSWLTLVAQYRKFIQIYATNVLPPPARTYHHLGGGDHQAKSFFRCTKWSPPTSLPKTHSSSSVSVAKMNHEWIL